MKFTLVNLTATCLLALLLLAGCGNADLTNGNSNSFAQNSNQISGANGENSNSAQDDIEELGKIIKLPLAPEEVNYWEENFKKPAAESQNTGRAGKKLVVVLKFSPENAALLTGQIERIRLPVDSQIDAENRFPAELVAQSQLSGDESLKGKSYAADDFFQPPYSDGKITRIENSDYFVLELTD